MLVNQAAGLPISVRNKNNRMQLPANEMLYFSLLKYTL